MRLRLLFKYSSTFLPATGDSECPQRQLGDLFTSDLPLDAHADAKYRQRELGDRFRSSLRAQRTTANLNSTRGLNLKAGLGASTDSRRWYPTRSAVGVCRSSLKHPPTAVGGIQRTDARLKGAEKPRYQELRRSAIFIERSSSEICQLRRSDIRSSYAAPTELGISFSAGIL